MSVSRLRDTIAEDISSKYIRDVYFNELVSLSGSWTLPGSHV
jgi:hypothetical protein